MVLADILRKHKMPKDLSHTFLIMWCNEGLEYVADITADEQRVMWEKLQGRTSPRHAYANPQHLILRARYNPQRHYEIYLMNAVAGITEDDIRDMFESDPQSAADTVRKLGTIIHSDRAEKSKVVIV